MQARWSSNTVSSKTKGKLYTINKIEYHHIYSNSLYRFHFLNDKGKKDIATSCNFTIPASWTHIMWRYLNLNLNVELPREVLIAVYDL